jgi:hypothetical protein
VEKIEDYGWVRKLYDALNRVEEDQDILSLKVALLKREKDLME